jgi:hypothetical protein
MAICEATIMERKATEAAAEAYRASVSSAFFFSTLHDEYVERQPRTDHSAHDTAADIDAPIDDTNADTDTPVSPPFPSMAEILNALPSLSPSIPPLPFLDDIEGPSEPEVLHSEPTIHKRTAKRERNRATCKAHLTFDAIERELSTVANLFDCDSASTQTLLLTEKNILHARRRFDAVRRSVPSLDSRRKVIWE